MTDEPASAIVTGASGALGGALVRQLGIAGVSRAPGNWRQADVPAGDWLRPGEETATIVHAAGPSAALGDADGAAAAQLAMVAELLKRGWHGRLVLLSSAAVYGAARQLPVAENTPLRPLNAYGACKLAVERGLARLLPPERLLILRLSNVYGTVLDLDRRRVGALVLEALIRGAPFTTYGDGGSERDYLHIDDFCRAVAPALTAGIGAVNIGSGKGTTLDALIAAAEAVTGRRLDRRRGPLRAEAAASVLDVGRARRVLGWRAEIGLDEGLRRLFETMRAAG